MADFSEIIIQEKTDNLFPNFVSNISKSKHLSSRMSDVSVDETDENPLLGFNELIGIIMSVVFLCLAILVVASVALAKKKKEGDEDGNCFQPIAKRFPLLKKVPCCAKLKSSRKLNGLSKVFQKEFWLKKPAPDAQILIESNTPEPSIKDWQHQPINFNPRVEDAPKPVQSPFDDNFYEIDLDEDVITPKPEEVKENKSKEDENNLVSRYIGLLSGKYSSVIKRKEDGKTDEEKQKEKEEKEKKKREKEKEKEEEKRKKESEKAEERRKKEEEKKKEELEKAEEKRKKIEEDEISSLSLENQNFTPDIIEEDFKGENEAKEETIPGQGRCRALEHYDDSSIPGLLKVSRGEELTIIQKDFGSGFTSVRNSENQDGFVPTNMLHIFE